MLQNCLTQLLLAMNDKNIMKDIRIEELIEIGEIFEMVVTGDSMLPLLGVGRDRLVLRRINDQEDITERIAMFRSDNQQIVVHRVIDVNNNIVTLQGYGNISRVERVERDRIIAVLEQVIRDNNKEIDCLSESWRKKERMWLGLPIWLRKHTLSLIRLWKKQ